MQTFKTPAELAAFLDGNHSCRFATLLYTASGTGEVARHTVMFNVNRRKALARDLAVLATKLPKLTGFAQTACEELIASITETLTTGQNSQYTKAGYYTAEGNGNVQVANTGVCYVRGYSVGKKVIRPGVYKQVKSSPKTLAKNELRRGLKNPRIREFRITPENFSAAHANGAEIVIDATATNLNKLAGLPPVTLAVPVPA